MTARGKLKLAIKSIAAKSIVASIFILHVEGFSRGAPDAACTHMIPGHGGSPKPLPAPFAIAADKVAINSGENVQVAIGSLPSSPGLFKGFLINARDATTNEVIGTFEVPLDDSGRLMKCSGGTQNGVTHANNARKQRVVLTWQSPANFEGDVVFRGTFVEDYSNYWVNVESERVRVSRSIPFDKAETPLPITTPELSIFTVASTTEKTWPPTTTKATTALLTTQKAKPTGTPLWSFTTTVKAEESVKSHPIYNGCGATKGCFGMPNGCINTGDCDIVASYSVKGDRYEFELRGLLEQASGGYLAIGFSQDAAMGDDTVTECLYKPSQVQNVDVFNSINKGKNNIPYSKQGAKLLSSSVEDGYMYCKFEREQNLGTDGVITDLAMKHHLLLSRGAISGDRISYHGQNKASSAEPISIASLSGVTSRSDVLIRVHGSMMIVAWIWAASCGILFARYFKQTWVGKQFMGKDLWFVFHRLLMVLVWSLTMISFIIIFSEIGGWSSIPSYINPHPILGCVTTGLAFVQPIMAYFRPHPGTSKRALFNWAHWFVGNAAHIVGVATIFLAIELPKAGFTGNPGVMYWLLGSYVAFHVTIHLIFSVHQCCQSSRDDDKDFALKEFSGHRNGIASFNMERKEDAPGSTLRKLLLALYILFVSAIGAALIAMVALSP
ncbi:putative ferric-chelate reductase 1 homolog isoform X2 [Artemia franciscana]|nr:hypothetical protein QYM36_016524 [Artemia franciscana]KAK2706519.1 hypothetical protein QYM36_016524 [Artemia franciscana]KAK2706523.1 hypothetical protein QYM36_016524 [Artemia franciscana]